MDIETVTRDDILGTNGLFTWMFGHQFFVETPLGNFIWKDPDYQGDNSFTYYPHSYKVFSQGGRIIGRDKGNREIRSYCGDAIKIIINEKELAP